MSLDTAATLLTRLGGLNELHLSAICREHQTTLAEARVLGLLDSLDGEPQSPTRIRRFVLQTSGGLTATLNRLEQVDHVTRVDDPLDGRVKLVELTPAGRDFIRSLRLALYDPYRLILHGIDTDELTRMLADVVAGLERATGYQSTSEWTQAQIGNSTDTEIPETDDTKAVRK